MVLQGVLLVPENEWIPYYIVAKLLALLIGVLDVGSQRIDFERGSDSISRDYSSHLPGEGGRSNPRVKP